MKEGNSGRNRGQTGRGQSEIDHGRTRVESDARRSYDVYRRTSLEALRALAGKSADGRDRLDG